MKKILIVPILVLILAGLACSFTDAALEPGDIRFITDQNTNNNYHNDLDQNPSVPINLSNNFSTEKLVTFNLNDDENSYTCTLPPRTETTFCGNLPLPKPGIYVITASVPRGQSTVTVKMTVDWTPYTILDKMAQQLAGGEGKNPGIGYAWGIGGLVVIVYLITGFLGAKATNGSWQGFGIGSVAGFFTSMILLTIAVYTNASPALASTIVTAMVTIIVCAIGAWMWYTFFRHGAYVKTPQGGIYLGGGQYIPQNHQLPQNGNYNSTRQQLLEALDQLDQNGQ